MPDSAPRVVGGRYRLSEELGRGGMGVVWRAHDEVLDRAVALKQVLLPDWVAGKEREQAFTRVLREARSAARLRHPGVITIHDVVLHEDSPWIVMELLPAESLHEVVERWGPVTEEVAVEIGVKLLDALHAAHAVGITHRDVKPGNVLLLDDGGVVLTDFGVAHVADSPTITGTGMLLGSPAFMAPERLEGKPATAASDLWALGATLYNAVEGCPPYRGPSPVAVLASILMSEPRPMERAERLRVVIGGLMAKDPEVRMDFSTARAALVRAGGHPERTGSRALADLVRQADEADSAPLGGTSSPPASAGSAAGLFPALGPPSSRSPSPPSPDISPGRSTASPSSDVRPRQTGTEAKQRGAAESGGADAEPSAGLPAAPRGAAEQRGGLPATLRGAADSGGAAVPYAGVPAPRGRSRLEPYDTPSSGGIATPERRSGEVDETTFMPEISGTPEVGPPARKAGQSSAPAAWRTLVTGLAAVVTLAGLAGYVLPRALTMLSMRVTVSELLTVVIMTGGLTLAGLAVRGDLLAGNRVTEWGLRVLPAVVLATSISDWLSWPQQTAQGAYVLLAVWAGVVAARTWTTSRLAAGVLAASGTGFALAALARADHLRPEVAAISWALTALWMMWAARRTAKAPSA